MSASLVWLTIALVAYFGSALCVNNDGNTSGKSHQVEVWAATYIGPFRSKTQVETKPCWSKL